jgi:surface antigen
MKTEWFDALEATRPRSRFVLIAVALALLMAITIAPLSTTVASAASASSILCSGYSACSQSGFTTHGYQSHSDSSYWLMYAGNNCTNYVAFVESATYQVPTPSFDLGNGGQWASAALTHGVLVNKTPTVGSVAVWVGGASGMTSSGHVAVVEAVGPHGSYVEISQQHMLVTDGYDWVRIVPNATGNQWELWPNEFIHFASSPVTQPTDMSVARASILVHVGPKRTVRARIAFHLSRTRR